TDQFGTRYPDEADGMAADADGNLYVAGQTSGELPGQKAAGMIDAFVRRLDPAGHEVWTRQFGSPERDEPKGLALDDAGNVYIVGRTFGSLPGQTSAGGFDAFVRKYNRAGDELWTRQFGGGGGESAASVRIDHAGNAYVVGGTRAALPGQRNIGDYDAFVVKFDPAGATVWTRQFGTRNEDYAMAVTLDAHGDPIVAGETGGLLAGVAQAVRHHRARRRRGAGFRRGRPHVRGRTGRGGAARHDLQWRLRRLPGRREPLRRHPLGPAVRRPGRRLRPGPGRGARRFLPG